MSRRKGRILAFQALYSYDVGHVPLDELLKFEWEKEIEGEAVSEDSDESEVSKSNPEASNQETYDFARILISGTINHLDEIDSLIKSHLSKNWKFERVNKVSLAVMRISVFALLYQQEIMPSIVIDEAVSIIKDYGEEGSYKFINAVLDNIKKEISA